MVGWIANDNALLQTCVLGLPGPWYYPDAAKTSPLRLDGGVAWRSTAGKPGALLPACSSLSI